MTQQKPPKPTAKDEVAVVGSSYSLIDLIQPNKSNTLLGVLFCTLVRLAVGLGTYSGYNTPPMFGDFEAQKNWLSTTYHLPISQWYYYKLFYWGIDYPPLTCYHSYIQGFLFDKLNPSLIALETSKGLETEQLKVAMRLTVLVFDWVFFFSAWYYTFTKTQVKHKSWLYLLLLNPATILIDHGHFQYNCVMLGLSLLSFTLLSHSYFVLGSISFVLALSYKQMALYYALPIFFYILGKVVNQKSIGLLFKVGCTVTVTFTLVLFPFLWLEDRVQQLTQILTRLFPIGRGLFEDKVANFWCTLNVLYKLKHHYDPTTLAKWSAVFTLSVQLPALLTTFFNPTPSNFKFTLSIGSLSFFLFSFQVHEKSILLPLLPILLLPTIPRSRVQLPFLRLFTNLATFSLFPLLLKDGLSVQYLCTLVLFNLCTASFTSIPHWSLWDKLEITSYLVVFTLHLLQLGFPNPIARYPDIYPTLNAIFCSTFFLTTLAYLNYLMFTNPDQVTTTKKRN